MVVGAPAGPRGPARLPVLAVLLACLAGCGPRDASAGHSPGGVGGVFAGRAWFRDVAADRGIAFVHDPGAAGELRMPEILGGGVALFDADGDGLLDVYLTNGGPYPGDASDPGVAAPRDAVNRLYLQRPDGRFEDATARSGLGDAGYGMGVGVGDLDNDGDLDMYVANFGPDRLYLNRGDGTFEDATARAGVDVDGWSSSVAVCDYDGDGWLDLWVARYVEYDPRRSCTDPAGRREYCTPEAFPGATDVLLRNRGDGTFRDVSGEAGIRHGAAGLGVVCADLDGDDRPDFYVANDLDPNQLWINRGDGTFRDEAIARGAAYNMEGRAESGMGVLAADLDGDLDPDLFVTHLTTQTSTLYRNLGHPGGFEDATGASDLAMPTLPRTGFGTAALDVDLDGDLDLLSANGKVLRGERFADAVPGAPWDRYAEPNQLHLNDGTGRFSCAGPGTGWPGRAEVSRGLAVGDVDRDGDPDFVVANIAGPPGLYLNDAPRQGAWLAVRAIDPGLGREAIGAVLTLDHDGRRQARLVTRSFGYLSSSDATALFGLPRDARDVAILVRWPGGDSERFEVRGLDRVVTVERGRGESVP